jgi:hypothetical protein
MKYYECQFTIKYFYAKKSIKQRMQIRVFTEHLDIFLDSHTFQITITLIIGSTKAAYELFTSQIIALGIASTAGNLSE